MKINNKSREFAPAEVYKITKSNSIGKMTECTAEVLEVTGYIHYTDEKLEGEAVEILSLETDHGIYATNSATFIRTFFDIVEIMGELPINITIGHDVSKNGRNYIYADLA